MHKKQEFTVSVAPMMDWTDRHCRWFHRQLTRRVLLYTEMVVADAVIHGPRERLLGFDSSEHPVALQIGGSDPAKLTEASKIGEGFGYDEININIGCPSDRVQSGRFGACLMQEPDLVAECYAAMAQAVSIPVTVKCRLGVDDQNLDETLPAFIEKISAAGCRHFIIHARKAWLKGLSPKENRDVPPLDYARVRKMKADYPHLEIVLNGGLTSLAQGQAEAAALNGVMYGRAAYHDPWMLSRADHVFYDEKAPDFSRFDIAEAVIGYAQDHEQRDRSMKALSRHIMGLFAGQPGARLWRRSLSENTAAGLTPSEVIKTSLAHMRAVDTSA
jgi:tRNA-dihydrouridine synthase A